MLQNHHLLGAYFCVQQTKLSTPLTVSGVLLVSSHSWGTYLALQLWNVPLTVSAAEHDIKGVFGALYTENSCLPQPKMAFREHWEGSKTVKMQVRQLNSEMKFTVNPPEAERSCWTQLMILCGFVQWTLILCQFTLSVNVISKSKLTDLALSCLFKLVLL